MKITTAQTQRERLLELLQARGFKGVYVYEMTNSRTGGLGIAQYNTRIHELRKNGWVINNTEPGHFVLVGTTKPKSFLKSIKLDKKQRSELKSKEKQLAFFERVLASGITDENLIKRKENLELEINMISISALSQEEQAELLELNKNVQQTLLS